MSADIKLQWEWPADRETTDRILIKVEKLKPKSKGLFGIGASPSLAENLPDPVVLTGTIVSGDSFTNGKTIQLVAPKLEMESIKPDQYAVIGLVETDICICVVPVESPDIDIASVNCN